jgi:hypothetical protein
MKNTFLKSLSIIFALSTSMAFAQNLVTNPGFESSFTSWSRSGATTMMANNQHGGTKAVRLGTKKSSVTQNIMSKLKVGNTYKFSAWAKIGSMAVSSMVSIRFKNAAGALLQEDKIAIGATTYREYSTTVKVPTNAAKAEIYALKEAGASSYLYVDDFSVVDITPASTPDPTPTPIPEPTPTPTPTPEPTPTPTPTPVPTPIPTGYTPIGVGGGGAMSGVSISPYNNLWFVGTDMGTLFKSVDQGLNWRAVNHNQAVFSSDLTRSASVGFSADGTTVFHAAGGIRPRRSTDSGETFTNISIPLGTSEYIKYWHGDSQNENSIYCATNLGLLKSEDKGVSWVRIVSAAGDAVGTFIDSADAKVYHAVRTGLLVSSNNGSSFSSFYIPTGLQVRGFTGGRDSTGLTLSFVDNNGTQACGWVDPYLNDWGENSITQTKANCGYVWISQAGTNFVRNAQIAGDHIKMAENDASTVYVTGARAWIRQYGTKVHVSRNKGQTWELKLNQINYDVIPYAPWPKDKIEYSAVALDVGWWDDGYTSFEINRRNSQVAAGTGYFFMHSTANAGSNWKAAFTQYAGTTEPAPKQNWKTRGLEVITVYRAKFHPSNPNLLYAAVADIAGMISEDGGQSFRITKAAYNSHYDYAFDTTNDNVVYTAVGNLHDFPNEWHANAVKNEGGVYSSSDRGRTYRRLTPNDATFNRQFLSIGFDSTRKHIYAGTHEVGIARSTDNGATWSLFNAGLPAGNKIIPQIEVDPNNGNVYALLTGDAPTFSNQAATGIYFLNVAAGSTVWTLLRGNVNYPPTADLGSKVWYYPTAFAINFSEPNNLWLVDYENNRNWLMSGVWKSTDRGATWNRVKQVTHAVDIKIDPKDTKKISVAGYYDLSGTWGEGGQLNSPDAGVTWYKNTTIPLQRNARSVTIDPVDSGRLIYSFFGGGMLYGPNPNYATP